MTSTALLLATSLLAPVQRSSSNLANAQVWRMLRDTSAGGGNAVCAPTSGLAGISSILAAGIKLPDAIADRVGGDPSGASRLVGALYAADRAFSTPSSVGSSETSVWVIGAGGRDNGLSNLANLTPYYINRQERQSGVEKWLTQRISNRDRTTTPDVGRTVVTAGSYGARFFSIGDMRFGGLKVPFAMIHATGYTEDTNLRVASAPLTDAKKYSLVIAAPTRGSIGDMLDILEKNWREAVNGLPSRGMTLQFPKFFQTVDRSLDSALGLKVGDGVSVRERLTISLGSVPRAANLKDRKTLPSPASDSRFPTIHYMGSGGLGGNLGGGGGGGNIWTLNSPFFFAVADNSTGQIVFAGICAKP